MVLVVFVGVLGTAWSEPVSFVRATNTYTAITPAKLATSSPPSKKKITTTVKISSGYTMTQVAQHAGASSCWTVINGNVYDVTQWIDQHPGGRDTILSLCGADGSAAFNGQHGGQARPANELKNFLLGALAS